MNMQWLVFVLCALAVVSSVICEDEFCGTNNTVTVTSSNNVGASFCETRYISLNISQYFGNLTFDGCGFFFTSTFTQAPVSSWNDSFALCTDTNTQSSLTINIIIKPGSGGSLQLQSTTCFSDNSTISDTCECRMSCLLEFTPEKHPYKYFIYLVDIGCDVDTLNSSLMVYNNASNVNPSVLKKPNSYQCPTPVPSPSVSISMPSLSSSAVVVSSSVTDSSSTFSSSQLSFTPTASPQIDHCSDYNINKIKGTESYCASCSDGSSSTYNTLLYEACKVPSESNLFIEPLSAALNFKSFSECARATNVTPVNDLFRPPSTLCTNDMSEWHLRNASCDCSFTSCSGNTQSSSSCVLRFVNRDSNIPDVLVFSSKWDTKERISLEMLVEMCSITLDLFNCSNSTLASSSTTIVATTAPTDSVFFSLQNVYIQVVLGVVGAMILLILSILIAIILLLVIRRRRNAHGFRPNEKGNGYVSPITITGEPISPLDFSWSTKGSELHKKESENAPPPPPPPSVPVIDYNKWRRIFSRLVIDMKNIEVMETIGEGAFGLVQKGRLKGKNGRNILVAIKAMKDASSSEQVEDFVSESAIMLDFDHPNVLRLLGVCFDTENGLPLIILPYMANGDLKSFLQAKRRGTPRGSIPAGLSINLLIRMCLDVAKGMAYLARTKFVHRDLAARNCMVDENLIVRVADFGLSRDVYSKDYYRLERRVKLPVKWLPPESLHDSIFNEKTDVWSFGVTCWEVFSLGRTPYPSIDNADVLDYVEKGFRLKKVPLCPKEVYLMLSQCWDESPEFRPCFTIIVESLKEVISNWESNGSTLKRQMETELQSSLEQEGYESDTLELDATNSMATKVGSRARYPSLPTAKGRKPSQISCASSIGITNINSTTALLPHKLSESTVAATPGMTGFQDTDLSASTSEDDCRIQDSTAGDHEYYNFTPEDYEKCQCCHGDRGSVTSLDKLRDCRHILNSSSNSNDHSVTPPSVPIFEMFYNDSNQLIRQQPTSKPSTLKFRERDGLVSQSSCTTEVTVLPDTPLGSNLFKSMEEPADYSLPIKTTPTPPQDLSDVVPPRTRGGGPNTSGSRSCSLSSGGPHPPSTRASTGSTGLYDKAATIGVTSPTNHFYFTLDPNCRSIHSPPAVFDSDSDTPKHCSNATKAFRNNSTSLDTDDQGSITRYSDFNHSGSDPRDKGYIGYSPVVSSTEEELTAIDGSLIHHHMLLEHIGQRFECEFSP